MSETPIATPEGEKPPAKESEFDRDSRKGPVLPANEDLYQFLSTLFAGEGEFPEQLECRMLVGRGKTTYGDVIWQKAFKGGAKPNEQQIANFSNQATHRMRVCADNRQKETHFIIGARNHDRHTDYYEVMHFTVMPGKKWKNGERGNSDEEDDEFSASYNRYFLDHIKDRDGTMMGFIEGLIDRSDRQAATAQGNFERMMGRYIELLEVNLKLVQAADERQERIEKARMWRENLGKGLDMAWSMIPPLLAGFKKNDANWQPNTDSPEARTIRELFREKDGPLTTEQQQRVFGKLNANGTPEGGILSEEQTMLLVSVARAEINPENVDNLLPGARLAITQDQIMRIMAPPPQGAGVSQEALAPLYTLIQVRMNRRQELASKEKEEP